LEEEKKNDLLEKLLDALTGDKREKATKTVGKKDIFDMLNDLTGGKASEGLLKHYAETYGIDPNDHEKLYAKAKSERDVKNKINDIERKFNKEKGIEYGEGHEHIVFSIDDKGKIGDTRIWKDPKGVIMSYTMGDDKARVATEQERQDYFSVQEKRMQMENQAQPKRELKVNVGNNMTKTQGWQPTKERIRMGMPGQQMIRSKRLQMAAIGKAGLPSKIPAAPVQNMTKVAGGVGRIPLKPF